MKNFSILMLSMMILTACASGPELPDTANMDLPDANEIQDQVNADLAAAGLDEVDFDADEKTEVVAGAPLNLPSGLKDLGKEYVTAGEIWPEVKEYATAEFPDAILIGYNNHANGFIDTYLFDTERTIDKGADYMWEFVFATDMAALEDGEIDSKSEAFSVLFDQSALSFEPVDLYPADVSGQQLFGEELLTTDTNELYALATAAVSEDYGVSEFMHMSLTCAPVFPTTFADGRGKCEAVLYETYEDAFLVSVMPLDGKVEGVEEVTLTEF